MAKFKMLGAMAMIATGLVGFAGYKYDQKTKRKHVSNTFAKESIQDNSVTGFKISDINNNKYLKELAMSIDENPIHKGKKTGVLENGKEMSIFLQKASNIIYFNKKEAQSAAQVVNDIADSANEDTYIDFKQYCYRRGDNGHQKSKLWPILDRMDERFGSKTNVSLLKENNEGKITDDYEIEKGYSYEDLVRIFYPSLVQFCNGSMNTAVFIFKYQAGIDDDDEQTQQGTIKLPEKINGCKINKNGFKKLKNLRKVNA